MGSEDVAVVRGGYDDDDNNNLLAARQRPGGDLIDLIPDLNLTNGNPCSRPVTVEAHRGKGGLGGLGV